MSEIPDAVRQIENDFKHAEPPFDEVEFPEQRLLKNLATDDDEVWRLSAEDKLAAISLFSTLDYNRNANQLVDKILDAADHDGFNIFNVHEVSASKNGVEYLFKDVPFRYKSRDAHAWHKNCSIIVNKYNGKWHELLLDTGCDATSLVERLNEDDFNCLKGSKIAPMYARIINDEVCDLHNTWDLEIPVDTWVRKITQEMVGENMSDDDIRDWWRVMGEEAGVDRHVIDGGIWQIGNNLDDWGEEYLKDVLEIESFKYL
jgi:hypothetical protein